MDLSLRRDLLTWYDGHRRSLPWRGGDAYAVFVSEVMLQQTRVETVLRHFPAWMARFPDWDALAGADEEAVMEQWAGLGYYRRARNLHLAARHIAAHGLPQDADGLRALPGVGPYMAGAVASIAFGEPVPAVDGNVVRVLSRLAYITECVDQRAGRRLVEDLAATLVDPLRPGDWNQALMDLGATVCTPRNPRCDHCPVAAACKARRRAVLDVPVRAARRRPREEHHHFALIEHEGRVLVVARPDDGLLAGTWMLPGGPVTAPLAALVEAQTGMQVELGPASDAQHTFTHRVWTMHVHTVRVLAGLGPGGLAHWVDPAAPDRALSRAARKAIAAGRTAARR